MKNTTDTAAAPNLYTWYYRETNNSEKYPGVEFGTVSGSASSIKDGAVVVNVGANASVTLTLTGNIPDTWNDKSEILIVASDEANKRMGQGGYPIDDPASESSGQEPDSQEEKPEAVRKTAVNLAKPKSVKAKVRKNKVTVSWKKLSKTLKKQIKSIEVQYSTDKKFKKAKTKIVKKTRTNVKLKLKKKKTYYVRVRYVGKDGFSKWSKVKKFKTKK